MKHNTLKLVLPALFAALLLGVGDGGRSEARSQATEFTFLPVTMAQSRGALPLSIFGLQLYSSTGPESSYFGPQMQTAATWLRVPLWWFRIEPDNTQPANFVWGPADAIVSGASHGFEVIAVIDEFPDWAATGDHGPVDKVPISEYTQYLTALAERYDGDGYQDAPGSPVVRYWEIINEPDHRDKWGNIPQAYADFLALSRSTIKAAHPGAKILFGGIAYDWFEPSGPFVTNFLDSALAAGACASTDYMAFHAYPAFASNWALYGPGLIEKAAAIQAVVQNRCGAPMPTIVTELGWHSNANANFPNNTPEIQACYVVQLGTQSKAAGLTSMIWWMLHDPEPTYPYQNGLVTAAGAPKPALAAFHNMVAELSAADYVRQLSAAETGAPDLEVHQFSEPARSRTLYVAWVNPADATVTRPLRLPAGTVIQRTMYGQSSTLRDGDDGVVDGWVTATISPAPVYLEVGP